jgi:hypothetical protein
MAACGGPSHSNGPSHTPSHSPAAAVPSPTPSYGMNQIAKTLLTPTEVAPRLTIASSANLLEAIPTDDVPACSDSLITLPNVLAYASQQFEGPDYRTTGINYLQVAALFATPATARSAFSSIQQKIGKCPPKKSFPETQVSSGLYRLPHTDAWKTTHRTLPGWTGVDGFEKNIYPPNSAVDNVYYGEFDYALRGNLVLSLVYWRRTTPATRPDIVTTPASAVLLKQLAKIGSGNF